MTSEDTRIALVTGANRGIGLAVVRGLAQRGYVTILGSRDLTKGTEAAASLAREGLSVLARQLDVTDQAGIDLLAQEVTSTYGRLDVLVNNAAILYDKGQTALNADLTTLEQAMDTNVYGALRMAQAFGPLLQASKHGRLVNLSSQLGSLANMGGGAPAYSLSKAALNALTRKLAADIEVVQKRVIALAFADVGAEIFSQQILHLG